MATKIEPIYEDYRVFQLDRAVNLSSKKLYVLDTTASLPDLRLQDINIETEVQRQVSEFLSNKYAVAVLLGPTGCGKTHILFQLARHRFIIFIDATQFTAIQSGDLSVEYYKLKMKEEANQWTQPNQYWEKCYHLTQAFVLARVMFFYILKERFPDLNPFQFLIYQLMQTSHIEQIFTDLLSSDLSQVYMNIQKLGNNEFLWCFDEAHVLRDFLDTKIISEAPGRHMESNGDVKEMSKRGALSVLLKAIRINFNMPKVILAGTSRKLQYIENFGTHELKPTTPFIINKFKPWNKEMSISKVYYNSMMKDTMY
jgi:hypothetical protein